MDTAAYIVSLAVFVAIAFWYLENEMKKSDGAHGLFAVRQAEKARKPRQPRGAGGADAARYRARDRGETGVTTPPPAAAAAKADPAAADAPRYRPKERAWNRAAKLDNED